ncbi:HAD family hydrolase [Agromyces sp. H3Y2-19a]|uniref:HAD family hydrolase n=1 Tax=Agromyces TaxID=33877 RepID=UPI001E5A8E6A|nr:MULTISPECIES: HAD family hydrolase [Agromyces]MCD5347836.1 HAD family hydrolase [Agromyces sp. S2-1-8]MDF0514578.1 HAD family hydrolase [Agromyces chromiiresistens]
MTSIDDPSTAPRTGAAPLVLFDLDDTLMAHREAVAMAIVLHMRERAYTGDHVSAQRLWHELEEQHYHEYLAGRATYEGQRRARARDFALAHDDELDDLAASAWFERYFERYRESWSLHDDALPALDAVATALPRVRLGVITNGELDLQLTKLDRLGLRERFELVIASGDVGVAKPDPAIFELAVARFGEAGPVGRAAYVGDRLVTDAIGAARAGLVGVWLNRTGARPDAADAEAAADAGVIEIASLDELAPVLGARLDPAVD